jgi:hypothetical protein
MVNNETTEIKILDWDWSGENGKVQYPHFLNDEIPWAQGKQICTFFT